MRARNTLGGAGRSRRVELDRRLAIVELERAGVFPPRDELLHLARVGEHQARARVRDAVVEVRLRRARGKRHEAAAEPLDTPVQLDGLGLVLQDGRDAIARASSLLLEPASDSR